MRPLGVVSITPESGLSELGAASGSCACVTRHPCGAPKTCQHPDAAPLTHPCSTGSYRPHTWVHARAPHSRKERLRPIPRRSFPFCLYSHCPAPHNGPELSGCPHWRLWMETHVPSAAVQSPVRRDRGRPGPRDTRTRMHTHTCVRRSLVLVPKKLHWNTLRRHRRLAPRPVRVEQGPRPPRSTLGDTAAFPG